MALISHTKIHCSSLQEALNFDQLMDVVDWGVTIEVSYYATVIVNKMCLIRQFMHVQHFQLYSWQVLFYNDLHKPWTLMPYYSPDIIEVSLFLTEEVFNNIRMLLKYESNRPTRFYKHVNTIRDRFQAWNEIEH